jgi:His-Xaa-Ser system protein HxsD
VTPVRVKFDRSIQALEPLQEAAYRLIGVASCQIESDGVKLVCVLTPAGGADAAAVRTRFLDLVIDENIRARVSSRTEKVRDVILSLAFGALAAEPDGQPASPPT